VAVVGGWGLSLVLGWWVGERVSELCLRVLFALASFLPSRVSRWKNAHLDCVSSCLSSGSNF
jgi:hypothetical protein